MVRIKYIFLVFFISCMLHSVDLRTHSFCQAVRKKPFWKTAFVIGCSNPESSWWECLQHTTSSKLDSPNFWDKIKSATQCFTWEVFKEAKDSDDLVKLPFENVINLIEFIIKDFIEFYIEYVTNIFTKLWSLKILSLLVNPATIFLVAMYVFHRTMFLPLLQSLKKELEMEEEVLESCSSCDIVNISQEIRDSEDIELNIE